PCRRFADHLAVTCARLGADVVRYSFIAVDFHHLLLAGLPAHLVFAPQFPERLFLRHLPDEQGDSNGNGQIGPVTNQATESPVYPINYANNLDKATVVSGHGTHVTGLVMAVRIFNHTCHCSTKLIKTTTIHG
ncbi:hypothetical protein, partial [Candidatus Burkholderia verschuerenii]|uniref:hypothetical protein n=1 Tax=Candidatus Burkholderia verschuerenii TaxID=242163 RepID=UPI001E4C7153